MEILRQVARQTGRRTADKQAALFVAQVAAGVSLTRKQRSVCCLWHITVATDTSRHGEEQLAGFTEQHTDKSLSYVLMYLLWRFVFYFFSCPLPSFLAVLLPFPSTPPSFIFVKSSLSSS
jgi:hypothetical protein